VLGRDQVGTASGNKIYKFFVVGQLHICHQLRPPPREWTTVEQEQLEQLADEIFSMFHVKFIS
jgi:hypothetical protein